MTMNYKQTIRLPQTNFPMKANLGKLSTMIQQRWEQINVYQLLREQRAGKPKFILHDGPPYANGHIHLGTALNKILKDIIVKGRSVLGFDAPLVVGWDCHGLPIEWKVEENFKKTNVNKTDINIIDFRGECRKFAQKWLDIQLSEFKKLGLIADFDNPYITMDYLSEALIYQEITKLINDDYLYLGKKPVLWSVVENTALAEAEVEYIDKVSNAIFVGFEVVETPNPLWQNALTVIWTTTPWTIPANQAIAYNPEVIYGLYEIHSVQENAYIPSGAKIIVAKDLAEQLFQQFLFTEYTLLDESNDLSAIRVKHPLYEVGFERIVPLLPANFVDITVGTGLVHMAPAYGLDDFYLSTANNITPKDIITDQGIYQDDVPVFRGQHIFKAEDNIINTLRQCHALVLNNKITHSYPCSWRSKAPLIYRLTQQWFLSLQHNNLQQRLLDAINNDITFLPKIAQNRLYSMVAQRPDWCLSRQRIWGVPMAIFVHRETEELLKDVQTYNNIYKEFVLKGSDVWFEGDPRRFLAPHLNKDDYLPVFDVVDVWFDSGSSHVYTLQIRPELEEVADLYIEGSDQHRGWFQSSLIESMAVYNRPPYKAILTHGFVLDEKGQKMSKSLGNVIAPLEIIDQYGLDILRLWVTNSDYQLDVRAGLSIFKQQTDIYRKIRNTLRYLLGNLTYFTEKDKVAYVDLPDLEQLMLHNVYLINDSFKKCFLETYDFHSFFSELHNFMTVELSAFYFDIRKDALYCDSTDDIKVRGCLTVLDILFEYLVKWLSPFISVTAEEAFLERYPHKQSVLLEMLQDPPNEWYNPELFQRYEYIKHVRKVVNTVLETERANKTIGSSLEAAPIIYVHEARVQLLEEVDFASILLTSDVFVKAHEHPHDGQEVEVVFKLQEGEKCVRCWKIATLHNDLCPRCATVVSNNE